MKKAILALTLFLTLNTAFAGLQASVTKLPTLLNRSDTVATDAKLVEKAMHLGIKEVAESESAQTKVRHPKLRDFASMMINEHTRSNQELMSLAAAQNIPVPTEAYLDNRKVMDAVNEKAGTEFERRYIKTMIQDHTKAVRLYERAARTANNPELRKFFQDKIPKLKAHLQQAESLNDSINK